MPVDSENAFRFVNVTPGEYVVRTSWQHAGNQIHFAAAGALLDDTASDVDLGALSALTGHSLGVRIQTVDRGGASLETQLHPALTVSGHLTDADGQPVTGRILQWSLPSFGSEDQPAWIYRTQTDASGAFAVSGIVPGVELRPQFEEWQLPTSAAGTLEVELRDLRDPREDELPQRR